MWDFCFIADVCASDANVGGVTDPKMAWSEKRLCVVSIGAKQDEELSIAG